MTTISCLPNEIVVTIASFLEEALDVCSLGSCSKLWYELCASDCLWFHLCNNRWPHAHLDHHSNSNQGWRLFYISMHRRLSGCASNVIKFVEQSNNNESLEVGNYLRAVDYLRSMDLGFKDVQLFLLAKKQNVLLNLIGLHYSIFYLGISLNGVMEALDACQVTERQVCVSWFKFGMWFFVFCLPDEHCSRKVSLAELATAEGSDVLGVLNRGVVHEVIRVQITSIS